MCIYEHTHAYKNLCVRSSVSILNWQSGCTKGGELPEGQGVSTWFVDGNMLKSWTTSVEKGVALWNEVRSQDHPVISCSLLHIQGIHHQMSHNDSTS